MIEEILIHKVKITKDGVDLIYDDPSSSDVPDGLSRTGKGEARPSFYKAMNALRDDVIDACLLDPNGWDDAEIIGITLKHSDGEIRCIISAQNKNEELSATICVNTPLFKASTKLRAKLDLIQDEACAYIAGKRAQTSLFDTDEPINIREEVLA